MRYSNDDFQDNVYDTPNYPIDIELMELKKDPLIAAEINSIIDHAQNMGLDVNDQELMGGFLDSIVNTFKTVVGTKQTNNSGAPLNTGYVLTTPAGTATIGPAGVSWTSPEGQAKAAEENIQLYPVPATTASTSSQIIKIITNPYVLTGVIAIPIVLHLLKKKRK